MSDKLKTAETKEDEVVSSVGGNADANQTTKDSVNDAQFTDTPEEESKKQEETETKKQEETTKAASKQTAEQNSENARRRREAERQKELQAAREQAIIETLGGKNPYTNEEMKDSTDVQEYLAMKEIDSNGGDPLADYSKYQKQKQREKIAEDTKRQEEDAWFKQDLQDFATKHPEVDMDTLLQDKQFQIYSKGKIGNLPLSEIYEGYTDLVSEFEKRSKQKATQILANQKATPGALASPNGTDNGFFTREQVQAMSQAEVDKNLDKIRASMKKW